MILTDILSGTEPPLPAVGIADSVYLQVQTDGRIVAWTKRDDIWRIAGSVSNDGNASLLLHSTGQSDGSPFPPAAYTYLNSGILVKDSNNEEVFRIWATDPAVDFSLYIGKGAGANSVEYSHGAQAQTAIGYNALSAVTTGSDNVAVGSHTGGSSLVTGQSNVFVGNLATAGNDVTGSTALGESTTVSGNQSLAVGQGATANNDGSISIGYQAASYVNGTAIGYQADTLGDNSISLGYQVHANSDNTAHIGNSDVTDAYFGEGGAILHGKADAIVFPDSDPHIAGAAYWVLGVLTKSAG